MIITTDDIARALAPLAPGGRLEARGPRALPLAGLAYDSRAVEPGFLFFALPGLHVDGHDYVPKALAAGAVAIVHSRALAGYDPGVAYFRVPDPRFAMSPAAAAFHGHPSRNLAVLGVTGTEGKSSTVYLAYQLLELAGRKAGFVSTVQYRTGATEEWNPEHQTTPEATTVQDKLAAMRDYGMEFAVIESSSHGLSPKTNRLGDVDFDCGIMTNVAHEHLEFHGTWEQYRHDKANLFRALDRDGHRKTILGAERELAAFGVACADDPSAEYFRAATQKPVATYSARGAAADLRALAVRSDARGSSFCVEASPGLRGPFASAPRVRVRGGCSDPQADARIELPGSFNVDNALGAMLAVAGLLNIHPLDLVPHLPKLRPVRGRMTGIDKGQPFAVVVDYAHTPSSFERVLPALRATTAGRLIALFGSGGERDRAKRPAQGKIAADTCDVVILADEDPRGEEPLALLEEIAAGCADMRRGEELFLIPDRKEAIAKAFALARPGDTVALLGKGHENSIIYAKRTVPYDEIVAAEEALGAMGYR